MLSILTILTILSILTILTILSILSILSIHKLLATVEGRVRVRRQLMADAGILVPVFKVQSINSTWRMQGFSYPCSRYSLLIVQPINSPLTYTHPCSSSLLLLVLLLLVLVVLVLVMVLGLGLGLVLVTTRTRTRTRTRSW
jgi:hypothetical protein